MIRVNLLPTKQSAKRVSAKSSATDPQQGLVIAVAAALLLSGLLCAVAYYLKNTELENVTKINTGLQLQASRIKEEIKDHDEIRAKLAEIESRERAIASLQAARTGPTSVMLELVRAVSPGRGPTIDMETTERLRKDNPTALPNPDWDTRRLWLTDYAEEARTVKFTGLARDGEDVSELVRRLSVSRMFSDIKLLTGQKGMDTGTKLELVKFQLSARARY